MQANLVCFFALQPGALHPSTGMGAQNTAPVAESSDTRDTRDRRTSSSTKNVNMTAEDKAGVAEKVVNTYGRIMSLLAILGALAVRRLHRFD